MTKIILAGGAVNTSRPESFALAYSGINRQTHRLRIESTKYQFTLLRGKPDK